MEKIKFELAKAEFKGVIVDHYSYELYFDGTFYDLFVSDDTKSDPENPYKPLTFRIRARRFETISNIVNRYKPEEFFKKEKMDEIEDYYGVLCGIW
jgi:hypothetical protein